MNLKLVKLYQPTNLLVMKIINYVDVFYETAIFILVFELFQSVVRANTSTDSMLDQLTIGDIYRKKLW
ncbi:MAG: hypothetical protein ACW99Q_28120 [Candidatus Kariarchaeaceae archaeon]